MRNILTQNIFIKSFMLFLCCGFFANAQESSIVFTNPTTGAYWDKGKTYNISWTATEEAPETFILYLVKGTGSEDDSTLISNTVASNLGNWPYTVPDTMDGAHQYYFLAVHPETDSAIGFSEYFNFDDPVGIVKSSFTNQYNLKSFPNPTSSFATISYTINKTGEATLQLLDINGRLIEQISRGIQTVGVQTVTYYTTHLPSGIYFLRLQTADAPAHLRLIVQ